MGDNIHQLTSLPYSNFEDEHSENGDEHPNHIPNLHVSGNFKPLQVCMYYVLGAVQK